MSVATADDQCEHRKLHDSGPSLALFQQYGMDVALDVIDGDQRFLQGPRQRLGKAYAGQQRARQAGPLVTAMASRSA